MNRKLIALGQALTYPDQAFDAEEPHAAEATRNLVASAAAGDDTTAATDALLASHPYLNEWVHQVLEHPELRPPHVREDVTRSHEPLLGDAHPVADRYICPTHGFPWYRPSAAQPVPPCPFGGCTLQKL